MIGMYTEKGATKRQAIVNGQPGARQPHLVDLACTPLLPDANGELQKRFKLDTPVELLQTYILGVVDVRQGDHWIQGGATYNVKAVQTWPAILSLVGATQLIVERVWAT